MRISVLILTCIALSGFSFSALAQNQDALCDNVLPNLTSTSNYIPVSVGPPNFNRSFTELERENTTYSFAKRPGSVQMHTLGLTTGEFNYSIKTQIKRITERTTRGTCLRPQFSSVLSFKNMNVYIANELENLPCLRNLTIEHENRHVAINHKNLILLTPMVQDILNSQTKSVYFPPGVSEQDQIGYVENLQTEIGQEVQRLFNEKNMLHYDFDRAEYQKNENSLVCVEEKRRFNN